MSEIYFPYDNQGCASGMKVPLLEALVLLTDELIDDGHYADQTIIDLRDSLAALLARHNALREAVRPVVEAWVSKRDFWRERNVEMVSGDAKIIRGAGVYATGEQLDALAYELQPY